MWSGGTSSIQTNKWGHNIAHLAKEWVTALQCLRTWERLQLWKKDVRYFTSSAKWPNWTKEWLLNWSAMLRIAQSPSRMTLFTPISIANSRALRAAKVFIIEFAVRGRSWPDPPHFVPQHQYQHNSLDWKELHQS